MKAFKYISVAGLLWFLCATSLAQTRTGAVIEEIAGTGSLKKGSNATEQPLSDRDLGYVLAVGWSIKSNPGGSIVLRLVNKRTHPLTPEDGWFNIPLSQGSAQSSLGRALDRYSKPGNIERPTKSIIYSPAPDSAVDVQTMEIRWLPRPASQIVALEIREKEGNNSRIWRLAGINGSDGSLNAQEARSALRNYRASNGSGSLLLIISDQDGNESSVEFTVLSANEERKIGRELDEWEQPTYSGSLTRHIARAQTFASHNLMAEAAHEYDEALRLAPRSLALIKAALDAHIRTGNTIREQELRALLQTEQ